MALFPQSFIDDVRMQADIVQVVQETVPLRKVGATYKGLCPFHAEKTPSFHVNRDRGFFHCFGCGAGGDVFKFVELRDRVGFGEAVRHLAERFGIPVPKVQEGGHEEAAEAEREALLKMHEVAAAWFREQLQGEPGERARALLRERDITDETSAALGLGYAPPFRDGLKNRLVRQGFALPLVVRSGLVVERDSGETVDRFRGRLMIPICRESGSVVAFGGRAMLADQVPKYLNSPETPVYSKSRMLYGLHLSKGAIRTAGQAVIVEGYFDFAQAWQGGVKAVVATCGTALTASQAQVLRRFASRVVISYDADQAGQGAAARSCELLVGEGFDVNVAVLPAGEDPDTFVRRHGGKAYAEAVASAEPYLDYLLERAARSRDLTRSDRRREFVHEMLGVAARIPDATARDQFADKLAHVARVSEEVVRMEIRRAAVAKRTTLPGPSGEASLAGLKPAERHLLAALLQDPAEAMPALTGLDEADLEGLSSGPILRLAMDLADQAPEVVPGLLLARLNDPEAQVLTALGASAQAVAAPVECVRALRRLRYERERADVQREIDRLQERGMAGEAHRLDALLERKSALLVRLEALNT
jgi:DNA primase